MPFRGNKETESNPFALRPPGSDIRVKLPRDISAGQLIKALAKRGYQITRQKGSHVRVTTHSNGEHHITVPNHDPLRAGTLAGILRDGAEHFGISKDSLIDELFRKRAKGKNKRKRS
jgi:predicted RNA binding protein YcfA (HicA-like mRNA interferase family)